MDNGGFLKMSYKQLVNRLLALKRASLRAKNPDFKAIWMDNFKKLLDNNTELLNNSRLSKADLLRDLYMTNMATGE